MKQESLVSNLMNEIAGGVTLKKVSPSLPLPSPPLSLSLPPSQNLIADDMLQVTPPADPRWKSDNTWQVGGERGERGEGGEREMRGR